MITLPHTGLQIPHARLDVHTYAEIGRPNGVAFTAKLALDCCTVGVIANEGNGGATSYQPGTASPFSHRDLAAFGATCRTQGGRTPDTENVLDLLITEHTISEAVAAATRHGTALARHTHPLNWTDAGTAPDSRESPDGEIYVCGIRHLSDALPYGTQTERKRLAQHLDDLMPCDDGTWQIWHNGAWTPLTSVN